MGNPKTKMICVLRNDLRNSDGNRVPKGKLIAQAGHAFVALVLKMQKERPENTILKEWLDESFVKVALGVDTEEELIHLYNKAIAAGFNAVIITDNGYTEFHQPTVTCIGIGPDFSEDLDTITGKLKGFR